MGVGRPLDAAVRQRLVEGLHGPSAVTMAGGELKHSALRLAAGGEERLVRLQEPPLRTGFENLPDDAHLPRAGCVERLLPSRQNAPTVIV